MPTDQFWARALLTPIALIFWLPFFAFIFPLTLYFNVAWWQTALGFHLYHQLWGGLVERLARKRLAQRHRRMLATEASKETSSTEEVRAPVSRLSGLDDYEDFMTRWFGRYNRLVHHVVNLAFLVFIFYPNWWTKALGVLWIIGLTKLVRASARRQRLKSRVDRVLPEAPTDALDHADHWVTGGECRAGSARDNPRAPLPQKPSSTAG
ncbi:hypothetical protein [Nannocystis punicea]|uniref:Glycosyl-4,4'-diaponeurosporenoate acyltransferase n=1 Tax=Nannocystis punicea TaxID=2995304 RepID=A0ABY7H9S3_9BACT|nr:hypothetical protein [Nannocystis poenicansa]WAS96026.1 hypothetical protein O0S08_07655 [Nannocystis poenicansa]